jgi:hypothetical protein
MKLLTRQEHCTALFTIAMYHWLTNDQRSALSVLQVALVVATNTTYGDA